MRTSLSLLWASALTVAVDARHVLHEVRGSKVQRNWRQTDRVHPDAIVPVRIGLVQNNLNLGAERLLEISDPKSDKYGQHLSQEEVHDLFAPSHDVVSDVIDWLVGEGVNASHIAHSDNKGWIAANIPAHHAEKLFRHKLYEYENPRNGHVKLGCDAYHVPDHLAGHIDYVTPGVKMSATMKKRTVGHRSAKRGWPGKSHPKGPAPHPWGKPMPHPAPAPSLPDDLQNCSISMRPPCWRALYGLPMGHINDSVNDLGLYEQGDYFAQSDISSFFAAFAPYMPASTAPKSLSIDGGISPVLANSSLDTGESDIDLDITLSLIYPQGVTVYQVDDQIYAPEEVALNNLWNTFLDALDGSYCNYTAYGITGDTPGIDVTYPDPAAGGYKGTLECGVYKPTRVISMSYGESESEFPKNYVLRQCNEFMKLGLQGHTIMVSSSDYGVGNFADDPEPDGCLNGVAGQNGTVYNPDYPSGCPWLLTVGATQLYANQTVLDRESVMQVDLYSAGESETRKYFASSGGFSNFFEPPPWQKSTIDNYFAKYDPDLPYYYVNANVTNVGANGGVYNRGGRGYPDVAANGAYMPAYVDGELGTWFGTSLASPIFASVVTMINQQRTIAGKGPVGFISPTLYAHPEVLNDIVNGSNPNCGSSGFTAVPGWDPTTGLGTPNYPKMLELFMSLP